MLASTHGVVMHNKLIIIIIVFLAVTTISCLSSKDTAQAENVRPSPLAGAWYSADAQLLEKMLQDYLVQADPPALNDRIVALISPHAGYAYSGQAAAYGFKVVQGKKYTRVIIIGPSHYERFHGIGVSSYDSYETPLGKVPVDKAVGEMLSRHPLFQHYPRAESREHSLEMQLPYLQAVLKNFSIVPLIVGDLNLNEYPQVAEQLVPYIAADTLIVVSSDFTHYGPQFGYLPFTENVKENLQNLDMGSVKPILAKDCSGFNAYVQETGITICGSKPIGVLLHLLPAGTTGQLLTYCTSGDLMKDFSSSVSYCSIVFYSSQIRNIGLHTSDREKKMTVSNSIAVIFWR